MGINNGTIIQSSFDAVADKILNTPDLYRRRKGKVPKCLDKIK